MNYLIFAKLFLLVFILLLLFIIIIIIPFILHLILINIIVICVCSLPHVINLLVFLHFMCSCYLMLKRFYEQLAKYFDETIQYLDIHKL
jgi:hypothetical protein